MIASLLAYLGLLACAPMHELQININRASVDELMCLPGIGQQRAAELMRFRSMRQFQRPADLLRVPGIGHKLYQRLKPHVVVAQLNPPPRMAGMKAAQ